MADDEHQRRQKANGTTASNEGRPKPLAEKVRNHSSRAISSKQGAAWRARKLLCIQCTGKCDWLARFPGRSRKIPFLAGWLGDDGSSDGTGIGSLKVLSNYSAGLDLESITGLRALVDEEVSVEASPRAFDSDLCMRAKESRKCARLRNPLPESFLVGPSSFSGNNVGYFSLMELATATAPQLE